MAKDHTTWDKESLRKAKYKVDIHREKEHPKVKGSDIDNKILQESYKVAKDILGKKLNANRLNFFLDTSIVHTFLPNL